ncbi:MAG: hypothetical protein HC770_11845, partial [Pseudanabaena sp. CRU_2_10]|nr:hypothetical protein [Pseudanabaena sp. CRU_2_10]
MHQQLLRSLPKFTLLTVCCLSLGAIGAIAQIDPAQAREKSAVSPDIVIPSTEESAPTQIESAPEPAPANIDVVAAPPAPVEVQTPQAPEIPEKVKASRRVEVEPVIVEVQSRKEPSRNVAASAPKPSRERVDIIMESRTSGCRSQVNDVRNLQSNLCAPTAEQRDYQRGYSAIATRPSFVYESSSGFKAEVRRLSPREIKAMSRPSNGDKRMQFPLAIPAFISSSFGYRTHPISGQTRFHQGTDIAAAEGTPVASCL